MREIKFRAWDLKNKVLYREAYPSRHYIEMYLDESDRISSKFSWEEGRVDLMQYTGMKDAKGVEICEGDIVSFDDSAVGLSKGVGEVYWCDDMTLVSGPGFHVWQNGLAHFPFHPTVIGNKYQNPELLN